jgi:uncharacterized membrane protein
LLIVVNNCCAYVKNAYFFTKPFLRDDPTAGMSGPLHPPTRTGGRKLETPLRSFVKAITWQLVGLVTMTALAFVVTGSLASAGSLALGAALTGLALFFLHERIWSLIAWGRG